MISQNKAETTLIDEAQKRNFQHTKWAGSKFAILKLASATEKGDIGEDFLAEMLRACGYYDGVIEVVKGRRGDYDVSVSNEGRSILFESKVATLDTSSSFQFNGIRYDRAYTHLFCLGISPNTIGFLIIAKQMLGRGDYKMASMAKGSNAAFKLTKRENELKSFDAFCDIVSGLWTNAP